jgi:hypothetical protein
VSRDIGGSRACRQAKNLKWVKDFLGWDWLTGGLGSAAAWLASTLVVCPIATPGGCAGGFSTASGTSARSPWRAFGLPIPHSARMVTERLRAATARRCVAEVRSGMDVRMPNSAASVTTFVEW